jgi:anti-anti-sigma regulatory factor
MTGNAFEIRQEFKIRDDVLAFGFRGGRVADEEAIQFISEELLAAVEVTQNGTPPSFVVLDMRQVEFLSSRFLEKLIDLNPMLSRPPWKLVLLGLPEEIQKAFAISQFDRTIALVSGENELRLLVERLSPRTKPAPDEPTFEFSEDELEEMIAEGITLEDAIREIERLRG